MIWALLDVYRPLRQQAKQPSVSGQKALDAAIDTLDGKEVEHDQTVDVVLINKDNIADFDVTDWQ